MWRVVRYACLGVPISVKHLDCPWKNVLTPRFPLFFSLLPLVTVIVVCSIIGPWRTEDIYIPSDEFILVRIVGFVEAVPYGIIAFTVLFSWIPFVVNLLLLGWCFLILLVFKAITKKDIQVTQGIYRVVYFSAFFQFLFFSVLTYLPSFPIGPHFKLIAGTVIYWLVILAFATIRVMSVFQGMRRETKGNIFAGLLSILCCVDVWWFLYAECVNLFDAFFNKSQNCI